MGKGLSLPSVETDIETLSHQASLNKTLNRDSIVTNLSIAGDSLVCIFLILLLICCAFLYFLHKHNISSLSTRLSNLAHLTGFAQEHVNTPTESLELKGVRTQR